MSYCSAFCSTLNEIVLDFAEDSENSSQRSSILGSYTQDIIINQIRNKYKSKIWNITQPLIFLLILLIFLLSVFFELECLLRVF